MRGHVRQRGLGYLIAVVATAAVLLVRRAALADLPGSDAPPYLFLFAVLAAAWCGGLGPGLLATALGGVAGTYFFSDQDSWSVAHAGDRLRVVLFLVAGAAVSCFAEAMYRGWERASQQRESLRVTLQSIGDAVITTDSEGRVTSLNPVAVSLTGWSEGEATGRPLEEVFRIVNERTRRPVESPVQKVLALGKVVGLANHTVLVARDGTERPIDDSAAPIRDAEGAVRGTVLIFRDITQRRSEEKTRALLAAIVESCDDAVISKDLDGRITSWNRGAERLYGYTAAEVVGRPIALLVPPEQPDELPAIMERLKRGERIDHYETVRACKDGSRVEVSLTISPLKDAEGNVIGASKIARDMTARRQAERSLRQQAERLRLLWEAAAVLLTTDDADAMLRGLFARVGPGLGLDAYFNFLVTEAGDALRLVSYAGVPEETARSVGRLDFGQAVSGTVALSRRPLVATHVQQSDDPKVRPVKSLGVRAYACNPLLAGDRLLGTLLFASRSRDQFDADELEFLETICRYVAVSYERLRLVEQLRHADRKKDEFLATLAHELRNPLAPLRNGLHILRTAGDDPAALEQARTVMERQVQLLVRLIDDLLDVSRITRGKLKLRKEQVDLAAVVRNAVEISRPLIEAAGHELTVALPAEPTYVGADAARLAQVFSNLLNNAAKYTERGGHIGLTAERQGGAAVVTVKDTGVGIPAEHLPHIFEMFAQVDRSLERSQGGLGIGLTLVKRLVEMHGGTVEARSDGPDRGSEFVVRLPVMSGRPADQPDPDGESEGRPAAGRCKVLVVDDNEDTAASLSTMLQIMGHDVRTASDGLEALEAAEAYRPDVVLLDIGLPKLNGYEVARRLRQQPWGRGARLIALTGWGQEQDRQRAKEAGFDEHLVKPVEPAALERLLATVRPGPP
jgi:PAS domain S-box-containing protein